MEHELQRPAPAPAAWNILADAIPALLWAIDCDGVYTMAAGKGVELFPEPYRPCVGASALKLFAAHPGFLDQIRRGLAGEAFSTHVDLADHTFESRYEPLRDDSGAVAGLAGVLTDVTTQRQNEQELFQAQKMESLGVMAGSVAHDFNNLLTAILGFAGLLKGTPGLGEEDREHLYLIEQSARRGADIASRLLAFSRGGLARFVAVDMREVVQETIEFVKPTLNDRIKLTAELPARPVPVEGDFGQLQQVLLNIVWNARDVLPEGGDIRIKLAAKGTQVRLSVSDSGPGIPPEVKARIFEPFFTTKERGSGTGLGLSISFGIVRGHHGQIAVDSAPGKGTTFALTFPLHADQAETGTDAAERDLILVVDDDDLVRRATSATLTRMGYNVVEVRNGPLAVELVTVRPARFAAVLLDLVMPGMAGRDVFRAVRKLRPDIPVIVCTGYAAAGHIDDQMKRSISGLLQKPFSPERLEAALHSVGVEPERRPARAVAGAR